MIYRVKEFSKAMIWDYDSECLVSYDGVNIDEMINNFLDNNPDIILLDIKYCVKFGVKENEDNEVQALLIYKEKRR